MSETQSIDTAIEQVERLYQSVTGHEVPTLEDKPYATIPPEKVPEEHVQEQVDRLIQTLSQLPGTPMEAEWKPQIALWEGSAEVKILVDLPGVERDAVHVAVSRGMLELSGTRLHHPVEEGNPLKLRYAEHPYGKFRRTMPLPHGARVEQLKAEMREGVLELRIPKEAEIVEVKTVTVG
ncbi:MAG TPA: Hsp20/alpha crystallin family protein [Candidatus Eisenbacteria bacterium]